MKIIKLGFAICLMIMLITPAFAAIEGNTTKNTTKSSSEVSSYFTKTLDPGQSLKEVDNSPIGTPLTSLLRLFFGCLIIAGVISIGRHYLNSTSADGEKASRGFLGMLGSSFGGLVLVVCLGMFGYFLVYSV